MAETISSTVLHPSKPPPPKPKTPPPKGQRASSSFLPSILYKLVFFVVIVALLPLFPSQAPDFVGEESVFTRVWELVHLLFVGIAVSYGLFSRRNADADLDKESPPPKDDSPRSFVSEMLHVPSVFDNDDEDAGSLLGSVDASKRQTWSSQYYRNEPPVVVAEGGGAANHAAAKHLFLPVRSLKLIDEEFGSSKEVDGTFRSDNPSRGITGSRNGSKESVVLPSPIPWTSRSGWMETKVEQVVGNPCTAPPPPSSSLPPPAPAADKVFSKSLSFRSPAAAGSSSMPSPKRLSPSRSLSPGRMKGKNTYKSTPPSTPPPPPPPPPPPVYPGHGYGYHTTIDRKITARSFRDELEHLSRREGKGDLPSANDIDPSASKPRSSIDGASIAKSVRTVRAKEVQSAAMDGTPRSRLERSQSRQFEAPKPPPVPKYATDDSESDDGDEVAEPAPSAKEEASSSATAPAGAAENEVDKKADEFIARFREQIRLQRIESIKRSTKRRSNRKPQ